MRQGKISGSRICRLLFAIKVSITESFVASVSIEPVKKCNEPAAGGWRRRDEATLGGVADNSCLAIFLLLLLIRVSDL